MLFTLQRYEFFSKSQQQVPIMERNHRCCLPCKGTNFLANHNRAERQGARGKDVVYLAKVRIFQQITTAFICGVLQLQMLFTLQRYEFFSKSQHRLVHSNNSLRCCLPCKGTNFLANHNRGKSSTRMNIDVVYLAKVRIFQQITTSRNRNIKSLKMLFTLQRYEFFSKSQHRASIHCINVGCCLPCKGTNFLANHNKLRSNIGRTMMLFTLQRYEFFSKSQPYCLSLPSCSRCCLPCKGTNFLANHNR